MSGNSPPPSHVAHTLSLVQLDCCRVVLYIAKYPYHEYQDLQLIYLDSDEESLVAKNHHNVVEGSAFTHTAAFTPLYSYLVPAWPLLRLR